MYRYIAVVLLVSCFEVLQSSTRSSEGICTKIKSKTTIISKRYQTTCYKNYRTCWAWNWLGINCKYKLMQSTCTKSRYEHMISYDVERTCCPGYKRHEVNMQSSLKCEKGCTPDGYYGESCSIPCNCPSNAYVICDQDNGTCTCTAGWTGVNCTEGCPDGYFGDGCENVCPCRNNATCNSSDGSCICTEPGWTGTYCDKDCPTGFYGKNCSKTCDCHENQTCDRKTGECVCKAGLTGENCTQVCRNMTYGVDCQQKCVCHPAGTRNCDPVNGTCECLSGKYGTLCENDCTNGTYGDGCQSICNCSTNSEYCRPSDGKCLSIYICNRDGTESCDQGLETGICTRKFDGQQCHPYNVSYERYMDVKGNILDTCACRRDEDQLCVPINGSCKCNPGYTNEWCREDCPDGTFGYGCSKNCSCPQNAEMKCDKNNGSCICLLGWVGDQCTIAINTPKSNSLAADDKLSSDILAGSVAGVAVAVIVVVVIIVVLCRRKHGLSRKKAARPLASNPTYDVTELDNELSSSTRQTNVAENGTSSKTYSNSAFKGESSSQNDVLYNSLDHNKQSHESSITDNENQTSYGHLNMCMETVGEDSAYDVVTHNQNVHTTDDTYDHMGEKDATYNTMSNTN